MRNFKNVVNEVYKFADEFLGGFVPGIYFCSYFAFIVFTVVTICSKTTTDKRPQGTIVISLFVIVLAYVVGTMFRRLNSREPDVRSAEYIYYDTTHIDDNDFAFAKMPTNEEYDLIIKSFRELLEKIDLNLDFNEQFFVERKKKGKLRYRIYSSFTKRFKKGEPIRKFYYSKPFVLRYIYTLLDNRRLELNSDSISDQKELELINTFIEENKLQLYSEIYPEYPYGNLKNYLLGRSFENLASYVNWELEEDKGKTFRSKSFIWEKKLYIKHYSPTDYSQLLKIEAHIRFMTAMWYANKILYLFTTFFAFFFSFAFIVCSIIICFGTILRIKESNLPVLYKEFVINLVDFLQNFAKFYFNAYSRESIIISIALCSIISILYSLFGKLIKKTILGNFHYQRIREIVSILTVYDILKKENSTENNSD
jgi:hypothetical protein